VRRLLKWLVVTIGVAALVRWLRRRGEQPETEAELAPDPADELRRKLAESRVDDRPASPEATAGTVEERRAEVHEQGRDALSEMSPPDEG
jgi:hypothetical protein